MKPPSVRQIGRLLWARGLGSAVAVPVAGMLIFAGVTHIGNPYAFLSTVYSYDLVGGWLGVAVAMTFPFIEASLGMILLFVPSLRRAAFVACLPLFLIYMLAQASALVRGLEITCGCFGLSTRTIGYRTLAVTILGVLLSLFGIVALRSRPAAAELNRNSDG
jgi:hypothetical protein